MTVAASPARTGCPSRRTRPTCRPKCPRNLLRALAGQAVEEAFTAELVCIVDTLDRGLLVTRKAGGGRALPPLRAMHWAKSLFEKRYLRRYR